MTVMYNGSKGPVDPATMDPDHLLSALAKLQREEPGRVDEIAALQAQASRNAADLEAKKAPLIRSGWRCRDDYDATGKRRYQFANETIGDSSISYVDARSKDGAWAKFIAMQEVGA